MELEELQGAIEAILFTMGESVSVDRIADALGQDKRTTKKIIRQMKEDYEKSNRGLCILELEDSYQLCTKKEHYETLIKIATQPKKYVLTDVLLETVAIIAYKQPVTRVEVEHIRGVKCDFAINKLLEYGLIQELGRLDAPGRPILFGTTEEFLRNFGVSSITELPQPSMDILSEIEEQAYSEAGVPMESINTAGDDPEGPIIVET